MQNMGPIQEIPNPKLQRIEASRLRKHRTCCEKLVIVLHKIIILLSVITILNTKGSEHAWCRAGARETSTRSYLKIELKRISAQVHLVERLVRSNL